MAAAALCSFILSCICLMEKEKSRVSNLWPFSKDLALLAEFADTNCSARSLLLDLLFVK